MAERRFIDPVQAEEASTFVLEQLSANDWARLKKYSGAAKPETFVYSVTANLVEEYSRKVNGRVRPPAWLRRQGELWITIWRQVCLERDEPQRVIDRNCLTETTESGVITNIITAIKAKLPWCGVSNMSIPMEFQTAEGDILRQDDLANPSPDIEQSLQQDELEATLAWVAGVLDQDENQGLSSPVRLDLEADERLLLKLHYQQGLKFTAIAEIMSVPKYQPARQIKKVLEKISAALHEAGVSPELLSEMGALE